MLVLNLRCLRSIQWNISSLQLRATCCFGRSLLDACLVGYLQGSCPCAQDIYHYSDIVLATEGRPGISQDMTDLFSVNLLQFSQIPWSMVLHWKFSPIKYHQTSLNNSIYIFLYYILDNVYVRICICILYIIWLDPYSLGAALGNPGIGWGPGIIRWGNG